ncbi:ATP-grasp domain-containing protein [Pararhizobium mangrovi]|uniref:Tetratricopeptide repeat-containing protein n=1 Tax=Pararhizobium mangrovi TaxID=2590452 RepID=A0A506UHT4_9HYPH|nr:tetratricopeptide repeat-containing protein [Pararhizobium mangrovi]TPW32858.1 tetratricopeptide repeat-containing protein [Pararhizobium mangrovi]
MDDVPAISGLATLLRPIYEGRNVDPLRAERIERTKADPADVGAWIDLSVLLQATGERATALEIERAATTVQPVYRRVHGTGKGPRVAILVACGDMMANTPVDFLLEGSDAVAFHCYVDANTEAPPQIPDLAGAILAIGPSDANAGILARCANLVEGWKHVPLLNGSPDRIAALTRQDVPALLQGSPGIHAPVAVDAGQPMLAAIAEGSGTLADLGAGIAYPIVVRPRDAHGGQGTARIEDRAGLSRYLSTQAEDAFSVSPFVDYSNADGLYRKQRIVFIRGRPFPVHLAVSDHWMVHYLSARMEERDERRLEEARWMEAFDTDFAGRHARAFAALSAAIGLDYFGIDCAEMPDGRLLLFEADTAMIVHDLDSPSVFPYKRAAMHRLFGAFQAAIGAV